MNPFFTQSAAIARRDTAAYFRTPIGVTVGVLFLAMSGWQFWLVVDALADPAQPALFGAVLETFFGGSALFWGALFVLVAAISMNAIAGERRGGSWELLTTSSASDSAIVVGKWLACLFFYAAIWLPTVLYPALVAMLAPAAAMLDLGPIAAAHIAVLFLGGTCCAIGVAASAATGQPVIAATSTFTLLLGWLFAGELRHLPSMADSRSSHLLRLIDARDFLAAAARGELRLEQLVLLVSMACVALGVARSLTASSRLARTTRLSRWTTSLLLTITCSLATVLVARHPITFDLSRQQRNTLSEQSVRALRLAKGQISVLVVRPTFASFDPVYDEAVRLLQRMKRHAAISIETFDPAAIGDRLDTVADEFSTPPEELRQGGLVLFRSGQRVRLVELLDMAEITADRTLGAGSISSFRAEQAFTNAIAAVTETRAIHVCSVNRELRELADLLGPEFRVERQHQTSKKCDVIVVRGAPRLSDKELASLTERLDSGGAMLWIAPDKPISGEINIASVAASFGVLVTDSIAHDSANSLNDASSWLATEAYGSHSIVSGFRGRRATVWQAPRALAIQKGAVPLVSTSATNFPIAAAAERPDLARAVIIGSDRSVFAAPDGSANLLLVRRAVRWLAHAELSILIPDKAPDVLRLILSNGQKRGVFLGVVIVIPALFGGIAGLFWWRRRRHG